MTQHHARSSWLGAALSVAVLGTAPAVAATSKLHPPQKDEAGTLRLAQVMVVWSRTEIFELESAVSNLLASGLAESDIRDGSLAMARVNCCNEGTELSTAVFLYVPPDLAVADGDLVVIRMGRKPDRNDIGAVNVAVEVRERSGTTETRCRWDPPNPGLWTRVLYCDWMPSEGWTLKKGLYKTWLKRVK